ncbi:MAG: hypothetical protein ACLTKG_07080 [Collinsella intestinalis]
MVDAIKTLKEMYDDGIAKLCEKWGEYGISTTLFSLINYSQLINADAAVPTLVRSPWRDERTGRRWARQHLPPAIHAFLTAKAARPR